jgi:hypothetical protein
MKINEVTNKKIEPSKPRNFVAKNMTTGGAGAHRDKKKEQKQGQEKHKGKQYDMSESTHTFDPMKGIHVLFALEKQYNSGNIGTYEELMNHLRDHKKWTNIVGHNIQKQVPGFTSNDFWTLDGIVRELSDGYGLPEWFRIINDGGWEDLIEKYKQYMAQRHGQTMNEDGEPMKIKAVAGNDVTIDQGGKEIKTTADALTPGQEPGTFAMKPADPNALKPGATVTQDTETSEDLEYELMPVAPDDNGIHTEHDPDLMGSGHNHEIGGDATDAFINQIKDKEFEKAQRVGREGFAGRSKKLGESDELSKMLTIAGLR